MKMKTLIIVIFLMPDPAAAQDMLLQQTIQVRALEQTPQHGLPLFIGTETPPERYIIDLNANSRGKNPAGNQEGLFEVKKSISSDARILNDWYMKVTKSLSIQSLPRKNDLADEWKLRSNNEFKEQLNANRVVLKIVLKETLRFTQEQLPEIDMLVRTLKYEISTDMAPSNVDTTEAHTINVSQTPVRNHSAVNERLFLKARLRLPIEVSRLSLVTDVEARYGNMSSFFSIHLDSHFNNAIGLVYDFNNDIQLRIERQTTQAMNAAASDRSNERISVNLIHLVCNF